MGKVVLWGVAIFVAFLFLVSLVNAIDSPQPAPRQQTVYVPAPQPAPAQQSPQVDPWPILQQQEQNDNEIWDRINSRPCEWSYNGC